MTNIKNFIANPGSTFNDNSVTLNATQNNSSVEVQPQVAAEPKSDTPADAAMNNFDIRLNPSEDKIDFIRVINAMCEVGMFVTSNGKKASKKDVFAALGHLLNENFSRATSNLGSGIGYSSSNGNHATEAAFDRLKQAAVAYNDRSVDRQMNK